MAIATVKTTRSPVLPLPLPNTDGVGAADYKDIDSDGDGIVDNVEAQASGSYVAPSGTDTDGDGWDNSYDADNGGTAIAIANTDGADNPDYRDTDSDNDTIPDTTEGHDNDQNGVADVVAAGSDTDGDGLDNNFDTVAGFATAGNAIGSNAPLQNTDGADERDWRDPDDDNDGTDTVDEDTDTSGNFADDDEDGDGTPDYLDNDDNDGDGVPDSVDPDDDNDGIPDSVEGDGDSDGDGLVDCLDLDSDGDGIPDLVEAGGTDADGDGVVDGFTDGNSDGQDDTIAGSPLPVPNTDGTGAPDYKDIDSDDDGLVDNVESQPSGTYTAPTGTDSDGDGLDDAYDPDSGGTAIVAVNSDGADNPDYLDGDSDNDTIPDATEGHDADEDGTADVVAAGVRQRR